MNFEVWPEAIELGRMFAAEGYELALVGGPVRDLLLHRKSHDLDFCTSARPEQFEHILRRFGHDGFWDMGRKFGTLGAMRRREDGTEVKVEVTTYRSDTYDPDSRKPEVNYGDTLEGDLSRRDFTVNAMALRVPELEFVDPFGGANDLAKGVLRTPVDPRQSFDDDPLRMMRAVRFVAQLGFRIEPETAEALSDMVDRIEIVSARRNRQFSGQAPMHAKGRRVFSCRRKSPTGKSLQSRTGRSAPVCNWPALKSPAVYTPNTVPAPSRRFP